MPAAIVDIDGTLVDSNYHHALAWVRAFAEHGVTVPAWRAHRHIGMGGDQLVGAVAGDAVERQCGDPVRDAEKRIYAEMIDEIRPLEGARELLGSLKGRGEIVILASSADESEVDHYLDLLDARSVADDWTSSADVESTKPEPDLIEAALAKAGTREAVMIGDSIWDAIAAKRAGILTIGVLSGGFGEAELREAGAAPVFESVAELGERIDLLYSNANSSRAVAE
jgi:HAD superfamily hydrolase (TIGR01509 family)